MDMNYSKEGGKLRAKVTFNECYKVVENKSCKSTHSRYRKLERCDLVKFCLSSDHLLLGTAKYPV